MIRKLTLSSLAILLLAGLGHASHMQGGSIRWECLPNGNYRFIATNYQDAQSMASSTEILYSNYPGWTPVTLTQVSVSTISPACSTAIPCSSLGNACYREHVFTSDQSYPNGIPITQAAPVTGWVFYTNHCCRLPGSNLTNSTSNAMLYRTTMFNQGGNSCSDSSPEFISKPVTAIYNNKPIVIPHSFDDPDGDSLVYEWGTPWYSFQMSATFNIGYSPTSPFYIPNVSNPAPQLNPRTGDLLLKGVSNGQYYYGVQVKAYDKCSAVLLSTTYIEFYQTHMPQATNTLPLIHSPLGGGSIASNIELVDTVFAGTLYQLPIIASDPDTISGAPQTIQFTAWSPQIDPSSIGLTGTCANPPCAQISPALPTSFSGSGTINFTWQTSCDHVENCSFPSEYQFHFKVEDNFCPIRGQQNATLRLLVMPAPLLVAPSLDSLDADFAGNVTLYWTSPADPAGIFQAYCIYADTTGNGNYYLVDSLTNYAQSSYIHMGANANYLNISYQLKIYSGCGSASSGYSTGSNSLIASFVGIREPDSNVLVGHIFPNPNQGRFSIEVSSQVNVPDARLSILDLSGRIVYESSFQLSGGSRLLDIDTELPAGIYMLNLSSRSGNTARRLIIY